MNDIETTILEERRGQVHLTGEAPFEMECNKESLAGAVSQRACVFLRLPRGPLPHCRRPAPGSRPHRLRLVHLGYTRRPVLGSGTAPAQLQHRPAGNRHNFRRRKKAGKVAFRTDRPPPAPGPLLSTRPVSWASSATTCRPSVKRSNDRPASRSSRSSPKVSKGNKREGYLAACKALFRLVGEGDASTINPVSINILGDFNLAGENLDHPGLFPAHGGGSGGQHHRRRTGSKISVAVTAPVSTWCNVRAPPSIWPK